MNGMLKRALKAQIWNKNLVRHFATHKQNPEKKKNQSYERIINNRKDESNRSIVVQVNSENSFNELCNYCLQYGSIVNAHHFSVQHEDEHHYILIEFAKAEEASAAIDSSSYNPDLNGVPVRSPFLWFKATKRTKELKSSAEDKSIKLCITNGTNAIGNNELNDNLSAASNIDNQIEILYERTKLNDLGVRIRFLAALQIEKALSGMFPKANALPFGSSVNGFGKMGCDLDLILRFDQEIFGSHHQKMKTRNSRLIYHTKENLSNGRSQTQRQMESIGDVLQIFLPGVSHVRRILQARVPIIKYHHEHLNLEVDLSLSNMSGFYMSELFYLFGQIDERVRPLTFCIRRWANACGLTNPSPGRWITNFSLTCLVMFFLQQLSNPVLPSLNALIKNAKTEDIRVTEDGINCTFGRDIEKINFKTKNCHSLSELLLQFYEFYSQFDFQNKAISLNEGRAIPKPDHSAVYIVNPLEQVLNVSKNISLEECERLRIEVRNAAWLLESDMETTTLPENEKTDLAWGLLNIFKTPEKSIVRPNMFFKPRMVEVSELFEKEGTQLDDLEESPPNTHTPIEFKDPIVKQQVQNIRAAAKNDLKNIHLNEHKPKSHKSRRTR